MRREKTAVEWLTELLMNGYTIDNKIITQAKQMEKEQIRDAFNAGDTSSSDLFIPFLKSMDESEVYYESKYGCFE